MDQLTKEGIIKKKYAVVDMSRFGLIPYEIFVKISGIPKEQEAQCLEALKKEPHVNWLVTLNGNYNLICSTFVTSPRQFYEVYQKIKRLYYPHIQDLAINTVIDDEKYSYPIFKNFKEQPKKIIALRDQRWQSHSLSKKQWELLRILADDSRAHLVKMANRLNITEKTARGNLQYLEDRQIITGYTCQLDLGRIGAHYYLMAIKLNKLDTSIDADIKKIPEIFYFTRCAGAYDLRVEFYVEQESRIYEIEQELYQKYGNCISCIHIMKIKKEHMISYFNLPENLVNA
jgi:DNA-binding Lrp family transcriptional regulator